MKKHLFYCDTGYQIFTVLNLINQLQLTEEAELVIYGQFDNARDLYQRLKKENIFYKIYFLPKQVSESKIVELKDLACAKRTVKKFLPDLELNNYETFYASVLDTTISLALYCVIDFSKFVVFDDGTGSYHGNIICDNISWKRRAAMRLSCSQKKIQFNINSFYLYSPKLSTSSIESIPKKINAVSNKVVERVFEYNQNNVYSKQYVYLDQPVLYNNIAVADELDRRTQACLLKYLKNKIIVRKHPRKDDTTFSCFPTDSIKNQWELECCRQLTDEHVLISVFSTASFQARIMAGKKCRLILLYKLYHSIYSDVYYEEIQEYVRVFSNCFEDTIVNVPSTWDDFEDLLFKIRYGEE